MSRGAGVFQHLDRRRIHEVLVRRLLFEMAGQFLQLRFQRGADAYAFGPLIANWRRNKAAFEAAMSAPAIVSTLTTSSK